MNRSSENARFSLGGGVTPVVRTLLWINGLAYLFLSVGATQRLFEDLTYADLAVRLLGLTPADVIYRKALWQPFTYMFLHRDFWHLLFNMLPLWWFGAELERLWGSKTFFRYYLVTGLGAAFCAMVLALFVPAWMKVPTFGASGAIFGLLLAFGLLFPNRELYLLLFFVIPVPVKAKVLVSVLAAIELWMLVFASPDGVSHIAHVGGMLFGLAWFAFSGRGFNIGGIWRFLQRRRMRRKLKLISKKKDHNGDPDDPYSSKTLH